MKTILDNNIFYGINSGKINTNEIDIKKPIVTNSNVSEFVRSYNLIYTPEIIKGCLISAMKLCNNAIIGKNPYMYILELDGKNLGLTKHDEQIIKLTEIIAKGDFKIKDENKDFFIKNWAENRKGELTEIAEGFNEWFDNIKKDEKFDPKKMKIKELIDIPKSFLNDSIRNWTRDHLGKEIEISKTFDWNELDLFLHSFAAFFKSNLSGGSNFNSGDVHDLYQLIYVQPNDKFWTQEKKWQKIIYEQAKKGEYLLEYDKKILLH